VIGFVWSRHIVYLYCFACRGYRPFAARGGALHVCNWRASQPQEARRR